MLAADRVTCQFQPIVSAEDTSVIFAQEALFRGIAPNGSFIPSGQIFSLATEAGILVQLDLIASSTAIRETMRHQIKEHIFIKGYLISQPTTFPLITPPQINTSSLEVG